ncbi:MAG: hypothetical protein WKF45_08295 [Ilumatobacteraceae bacterium]
MIRLDLATVLLQWSVGGMFFCWFTTRRREAGLGYGWLLRGTFAVLAVGPPSPGCATTMCPCAMALPCSSPPAVSSPSPSRSCGVAATCAIDVPSTIGARRGWRR